MLLLWPCLAESVIQRSGVRMFVLKSVCPIGIFTVTHQGQQVKRPAYISAQK